MSENKPRILAENIDEFKEIEEELKKLPPSVYGQINTAQKGLLGIECELRNSFGDAQIALPATTQLSFFDDFIGAYCHKYFIRIPGDMKKYKLTFVFVEELIKEK